MIFRSALVGLLLSSTAVHAQETWSYPDDIPSPAPAATGLAGAEPANVVRYFKVTGVGGAVMSPDGETVLFRSSITGEPQLFATDFEGGQPRQLTFGTGVSSYGFAPDGRILVAADTDGNERVGYTLLTTNGQSEERILAASQAFNSFGSFDTDGDRFSFANTSRTGDDFDIYVAGLGEEPERVFEGVFGFFPQDWRPNTDQVLVTETRGEDGNVLHILDVTTGEMTTLFDPEVTSSYGSFIFNEDGSGFWMVTNHERQFDALAFFDLASFEETGDAEAALSFVHEHDDRDINQVVLADNRYLVWTENEDGYSTLGAYDITRNMREVVLPELPAGIYGLSASKDSPRLAVSIRGPQSPGSIAVVELKRRPTAEVIVEPQHGGLDLASMISPEPVRFDARDGVGLQGLLYRPEGASGDLPVVINVHGGPTAQARPGFNPLAQYLVSRGIAVLDLNFRGSTGFGKDFARLDNGRNRTKSVDDVADAVAWIAETAGLDGDNVAVMGGSYGGYLTNAAVGSYPDLFKAGVSLVGVSDWVRALEEASPFLKASDVIEYGDITDPEEREFFASISPINNVGEIQAAMLFSHGANDPRDPVTESDNMVLALRERGVEVRYLRWPDEGHSVRKLRNRVYLYQEIAAFLEEQLSGE